MEIRLEEMNMGVEWVLWVCGVCGQGREVDSRISGEAAIWCFFCGGGWLKKVD